MVVDKYSELELWIKQHERVDGAILAAAARFGVSVSTVRQAYDNVFSEEGSQFMKKNIRKIEDAVKVPGDISLLQNRARLYYENRLAGLNPDEAAQAVGYSNFKSAYNALYYKGIVISAKMPKGEPEDAAAPAARDAADDAVSDAIADDISAEAPAQKPRSCLETCWLGENHTYHLASLGRIEVVRNTPDGELLLNAWQVEMLIEELSEMREILIEKGDQHEI